MTNTELFFGFCGVAGLHMLNGWLQYYKTYMQKSGEYKAIQENIAEVTKKTESIKNELSILTQNKITITSEKRSAIFNLFESYNAWMNSIERIDVLDPKSREESFKNVDDLYSKFNIYQSKFQLVVGYDPIFWTKVLDLNQETIIYKGKIAHACYEYESVKLIGDTEVNKFHESHQQDIIKQYSIILQNIENVREDLSQMITELHVP